MSINPEAIETAIALAENLLHTTQRLISDLTIEPSEAKKMLAAGKISEIDNDISSAINWYEQALENDPSILEARARLVLSLLKAESKERALSTAIDLSNEDPEFTFGSLIKQSPLSALTVLGEALLLNGQVDEAMSVYRQAIALQEDDSLASLRLAKILLDSGNIVEANSLLGNTNLPAPLSATLKAAANLASNNPELLPAIRKTKLNFRLAAEALAFQ